LLAGVHTLAVNYPEETMPGRLDYLPHGPEHLGHVCPNRKLDDPESPVFPSAQYEEIYDVARSVGTQIHPFHTCRNQFQRLFEGRSKS
jgi:hypothetical protein